MDALTAGDFPTFFKAMWGYDPFPWQADLVQRLATGHDPRRGDAEEPGIWPGVLDLPTGSGKTAALDIAVFHLALEADKGEARRAPIRIAYVVDRRLIVDDAFARAERLCRALRWALLHDNEAKTLAPKEPDSAEMLRRIRAAPVVRATALRLRRLAGDNQPPLLARPLRGGAPREHDWARTPVQPTILCSTVDQVGSRLMFRGYGVSDEMKPIHAGLLGSDCLILLDEAHLSEPFRQTLRAVERLRKPDAAPFGLALLTATPPSHNNSVFELSAEDRVHPILIHRLNAQKRARLVEIAGTQGVDTESRRAEEIAAETEVMFARLHSQIGNPAIGVVVNRVARARSVFTRLRSAFSPDRGGPGSASDLSVDLKLIIGPARPVDRDRIAAGLDCIRTAPGHAPRRLPKPLIVVATQTIEAGVDIDFDGLVTEAAAFDALRQRFGRLNRAGRPITPNAVVLAHKADVGAKADDSVYGDRIVKTWGALKQLAADSTEMVDFGIEALRSLISKDQAAELAAPLKDAPVLMPAYADLWSQTSPIPDADPDVTLFLHGADRAPASVQIVWRADVTRNDIEAARNPATVALIDLLSLAPPRAAEAIEVPIWAARAFLRQQTKASGELADAPGREPGEDATSSLPAFRYAGEKSERTGVVYANRLQHGDVIVVPAEYGGCDDWGWNPESFDVVSDVADEAARPYCARRFVVRVAPGLLAQGFRQSGVLPTSSLVEDLAGKLADHREDRPSALLDAVLELDLPHDARQRLEALKRHRKGRLERAFVYGHDGERPRGVVFFAPVDRQAIATDGGEPGERAAVKQEETLQADPATESEDLGAAADGPVILADHCRAVRALAQAFAKRAGLSAALAADISLAALLHDTGKADSRYQTYYAGGNTYGVDSERVLAKSGRRRLPREAWQRAGLPDRWRHEALSVRIAMHLAAFKGAQDRMLVLWLIGSHHGHGRPLFPHADNDCKNRGLLKSCGGEGDLAKGAGPQSLAFDFEGLDWAQMFETLKAHYGIWGLARLEAFIRLADHRASEAGSAGEVQPHQEAAE